ncbi:acyl-CoA dehydrogenase family protein [Mycolicibacterium thermoresistibile]
MTPPAPAALAPWPIGDPATMAPNAERDDLRGVVRKLLAQSASHEDVRRATETERGWSAELWSTMHDEMSIGAMAVPEAMDGAGFGLRELAAVLEETGRALLSEPFLTAAVAVQAVVHADPGTASAELLGALMSGETVAGAQLSSAGGLTISGDTATGTLTNVIHGTSLDALVVTGTEDGAPGLYLVDLRKSGVERVALQTLDPTRPCATVRLDGAPVQRLVGADRLDQTLSRLRDFQSAALAAEHVGIIDRLLSTTREYLMTRQQFDRPLASFQAIKHRLADLLVDLERSRSAAEYAAEAWDRGTEDSPLATAVATAVCTDTVVRAAHEAIQLHGGIAFTWEHEAHYYLRRALGDEALLGSARDARARIADLVGIGSDVRDSGPTEDKE